MEIFKQPIFVGASYWGRVIVTKLMIIYRIRLLVLLKSIERCDESQCSEETSIDNSLSFLELKTTHEISVLNMLYGPVYYR